MTFNKFVCQYRKYHKLNDSRQLRNQLVYRYINLEIQCVKRNLSLSCIYYDAEADQFYYKIKL